MESYTVELDQRGQITLPTATTEHFGLEPRDKVRLHLDGNLLWLTPAQLTWETVGGSIPPVRQPVDIDAMIRLAKDDRAVELMEKMQRGEA